MTAESALTEQREPVAEGEDHALDALVGGDVEVADYKTTGTDELADEVAKRVSDRSAVLMANHGLFAVGKDPKHVLHVAHLVERTAEIIWGARQLGEIAPIPDEVNETFAGYYRFGRTGKF